jgi:para-nitrobenzyl esterase
VLIFGQSGGGGKVNTLLHTPSAKGLFHKAVIQSGGLGSQFQSKETTQRVAAVVLEELGLKAEQVDSLQVTPFPVLAAAAKKATQRVAAELRAQGKPLQPIVGLSWGPSLDGTVLPYQPTDPKAKELSTEIPVMIGSTKNEFIASLWNPAVRGASTDSIMSYLQRQYGERTDAYIEALKKAYPGDTNPTDLIDVDVLFRRSAIAMADNRSDLKAPVYMYLFTWQSPILDGRYKALHCMEIPFVFNNIARCEEMTGGTPAAYALAERVSDAWIHFARTGNPAHAGLPEWPAYTPDNGMTMIFDNACEVKAHHDKDVLALTPATVF